MIHYLTLSFAVVALLSTAVQVWLLVRLAVLPARHQEAGPNRS